MPNSKSGLNFLQRIGLNQVIARPAPRLAPDEHSVHDLELEAPLPLPEFQKPLDGDPPPDRGVSEPWPYPEG